MKLTHKATSLALAVLATTMTVSCTNDQVDDFFKKFIQAPESSIERDVKGHEQIYAVHAILRMGYKGGLIGVGPDGNDSVRAFNTYHVLGTATPIPITQEIDIAKDDNGQMTITTERDCFDVIASEDICYGLELKYYDQNGMLINHQFSGYPFKKDKEGYQHSRRRERHAAGAPALLRCRKLVARQCNETRCRHAAYTSARLSPLSRRPAYLL